MAGRVRVALLIAGALAVACSRSGGGERRSAVGESCTRTADCVDQARCVDRVCVAGAASPSKRGFATLEDLARELVEVVRSGERERLRALLATEVEVAAAAEAGGASAEEKQALIQQIRARVARFEHRWGRLQHDVARRVGAPASIRFVRLVPPRVVRKRGVEVIEGDLDIRVRVNGETELRIDVEDCVRVKDGWLLSDPEVELEPVR